MWPGICRVHHAALLQLRGDWPARRARGPASAAPSSTASTCGNVAAGYVEIGEIRRRLGDLDGAEEAFAQAEELCGQQSAGLALVRLAQRRIDAATAIITRMLGRADLEPGSPAGKLLPARVQIAVAAGDLDTAAEAADELERIAAAYDEPGAVGRRAVGTRAAAARPGRLGAACATLQRGPAAVAASSRCPTRSRPRGCCSARRAASCGDEDGAASSLGQRRGDLRPARRRHRRPAGPRPRRRRRRCPAGLTDREAEVLGLVASGPTNKEIATALHLSERTVARHLSNIFTKIGVTSRTAAAAFAFEHDLARTPPPR